MPIRKMKTMEEMIKRVRRETRNATTGSTTAGASIKDAEFIDKLQDGQELCVELISGVFSNLFERTKIYTIDTSVENYETLVFPDYLLLGTRIVSVEYSYTGRASDYQNIPPVDVRERYTGTSYLRSIVGYINNGSGITLSEIPDNSGATVRVVYEISFPRLDVVKATLLTGSRSGTDFSGTFTTPTTVDTDGDGTTDANEWENGDYVTVIDNSDGTVLIRDGQFTAYNYGAGTFTIDLTNATYVEATVDAATATSLRLIEGGRTNRCELPDECEKYIVNYAIKEILGRDGSRLAASHKDRFAEIADSLLKNYLQATRDWPAVPQTDY